MSMTVALACGHGLQLLSVKDDPPDHGPWTLYPLDDDVGIGDEMTCIVCLSAQHVTGTSPELIPMNDTGKLTL